MRRRSHQMAFTAGMTLLAVALLATSALATVIQPPPPAPGASVPAPAAMIQDLGPEAFGVLPAIRPQDGNGLDFSQRGTPPNPLNRTIDYSGRHAQDRYEIDATPNLPESAPVIRPDAPLPTERAVRDFGARLGMTGPLDIRRQGGKWDYTIGALDPATGAQATLGSRGTFAYNAPDPGARCGEATAAPFRFPPPTRYTPPPGVAWTAAAGILPTTTPPSISPPPLPTYPPTITPTPNGVGSELCASRGAALDETTAAAVAQDFLARAGFLPDASYTMQVLPPDARTPTVRPVRWTAAAPNGGRYIGRDAARDIGVLVGPNKNVTNAGGPLPGAGASSRYRLRSPADLAAALQAGDAYVTLTLPLTENGFPAFTFSGNQPLAVHVTGAELGYSLAYTFDAQPYLLPVVIYTGLANNIDSLAFGKEIGFTAYVDAVMHPAPQPAPVAPTVPLPATPDLASLASITVSAAPFTRADFDALLTALGFDTTAAMITTTSLPPGETFLAKFPDGTNLGANFQPGQWQYDNGGRFENNLTVPAGSPDTALAIAQEFIATHHIDLSNLGAPVVTQTSPPIETRQTQVCYPLLINGRPFTDGHCGLRTLVDPGGKHFTVTANPIFVALQRTGPSALQSAASAGTSVVTAQAALDALAIAPLPQPPDADPAAQATQFGRLAIEDDPVNAIHHFLGNTFFATRGQAAPNLFTTDRVTPAYYLAYSYGSTLRQTTYELHPVWLVSGQIDIGLRHRVAPFTYLYPAVP